jgi:hypothetical protein
MSNSIRQSTLNHLSCYEDWDVMPYVMTQDVVSYEGLKGKLTPQRLCTYISVFKCYFVKTLEIQS